MAGSPRAFTQAGVVALCNTQALEGAVLAGAQDCRRKLGNRPCSGTCVIIQGDIRIYSPRPTLLFVLMLTWYHVRGTCRYEKKTNGEVEYFITFNFHDWHILVCKQFSVIMHIKWNKLQYPFNQSLHQNSSNS